MKQLKNWDNKTWLSSKKYIAKFNKFISAKKKLNQKSEILDIGCGRANIISNLQEIYNFKTKALGLDVIRNTRLKKNIHFKKTDAIKHLKTNKKKYDLILIKQTIHFFSPKKLNLLLNLVKMRLKPNGKLLIFSLKTKNNKIPCFKKMKTRLNKSLKRDKKLMKIIKKNLRKIKISYFSFTVKILLKSYSKMIQNRFISCLLDLSEAEINNGIKELCLNYRNKINFKDTLLCLEFKN